jgi:hypothetical protein
MRIGRGGSGPAVEVHRLTPTGNARALDWPHVERGSPKINLAAAGPTLPDRLGKSARGILGGTQAGFVHQLAQITPRQVLRARRDEPSVHPFGVAVFVVAASVLSAPPCDPSKCDRQSVGREARVRTWALASFVRDLPALYQ